MYIYVILWWERTCRSHSCTRTPKCHWTNLTTNVLSDVVKHYNNAHPRTGTRGINLLHESPVCSGDRIPWHTLNQYLTTSSIQSRACSLWLLVERSYHITPHGVDDLKATRPLDMMHFSVWTSIKQSFLNGLQGWKVCRCQWRIVWSFSYYNLAIPIPIESFSACISSQIIDNNMIGWL